MSRFILVCSCDFAEERFCLLREEGDVLVAVDAGFEYLKRLGLKPAYIIGDFDSLGHLPFSPGSLVMRFPEEKDESDLELALSLAEEKHADEVYVFGAIGGRLDQTLAALQTARGFADAFARLVLVSEREVVHVLGPNRMLTLIAPTGRYVSVLSAVDASRDVRIAGMKYAFEGTLTADRSLGMSNAFAGEPAQVSVGDGVLFIIEQDEQGE